MGMLATIAPAWCPILGAQVTLVKNVTGGVTRVVCAEYDQTNGTCRFKRSRRHPGPLLKLLSAHQARRRARKAACVLRTP